MVTYNYRNNLVLRVALSPFFNLQCALTVMHGRGEQLFHCCVLLSTQTKEREMGQAWERGYTKSSPIRKECIGFKNFAWI